MKVKKRIYSLLLAVLLLLVLTALQVTKPRLILLRLTPTDVLRQLLRVLLVILLELRQVQVYLVVVHQEPSQLT